MYDVVIVGAGPAGSNAAYHCAKAGLKTLLLEKEKMPRPKTCAGGFGIIFKDVPEGTEHVVKQTTTGTLFIVDGKKVFSPHGVHLFRRQDFDFALVKRAIKAGAKFKQEKVESVKQGNYPIVKTKKNSYQAKIVIGADGITNTVAKNVGLFKERGYSIAFEIEDKMPADIPKRFGNNLVVFFDKSVFGYAWIFPKGDLVNVGVGAFTEPGKTPNLQERMVKFLDKYDIKVDLNKLKGYPIPFEPLPKVYTNNVLLVGDAAGFVDPLSGGGIELAMISGQKAAKVAAEAVQANDFSETFLSRYVDECSFVYKFIKGSMRNFRIFRTAFKLKLLYPIVFYAKVQVWIRSMILKQKRANVSEI